MWVKLCLFVYIFLNLYDQILLLYVFTIRKILFKVYISKSFELAAVWGKTLGLCSDRLDAY